MDYKEKYEKAVKDLKKIKSANKDNKALVDFIEYEYPELIESEDEKTRYEIIGFVEQSIHRGGGTPIPEEQENKWIAWLEKQGHTDSIIEKAKTEKQRVIITETDGNANIDWDTRSLEDVRKLLACGLQYINTELEKQGEQKKELKKIEQKTTDKVEPKFKVKYAGSEYNVLEIRDIIGVTFYGIEDKLNHIDYVKAENCKIIGSYAIKENGSPYPTNHVVFSEQKPTWSEEDENLYTCCMSAIKTCYNDGLFTINEYRQTSLWLKSLKAKLAKEEVKA